MKIDMRLATVEWLVEWKAQQLTSRSSGLFRHEVEDLPNAQFRYICERLTIYLQRASISSYGVTLVTTDTMDRKKLGQLLALRVILLDGREVRFDSMVSCEFWYPYDENPSRAMEITFKV